MNRYLPDLIISMITIAASEYFEESLSFQMYLRKISDPIRYRAPEAIEVKYWDEVYELLMRFAPHYHNRDWFIRCVSKFSRGSLSKADLEIVKAMLKEEFAPDDTDR